MAYEIPIGPEAFDKLGMSIDKCASKVDGLDQKIKGLGQDANGVTLGGRSFTSMGGPPGGGFRGSGAQGIYDVPKGAEYGYQKAVHDLRIATGSGDPLLQRDAQAKVARAERALQSQNKMLDGAKPGDAAWDALMSSRVGPGGRLLPLVNKLRSAGMMNSEELEQHFGLTPGMAQQMAPIVASIAKYALPIAGGVLAVGAGVALAEKAAALTGEASKVYWSSGGTSKEIGQLMAIGGNAGAAMALGNELHQGTIGAAYMRAHGVRDMGNWTDDKTGNYIRALDVMRGAPNDQTKRRLLRDLPSLNDMAWTNDLSNGQWSDLKDSMGSMGDKSQRQASASYKASKQELGNEWDQFVAQVGPPLMNAASFGLKYLNPLKWVADSARAAGRISAGDWSWSGDDSNSQGGNGGGGNGYRLSTPKDRNGNPYPDSVTERWSGGGDRARGSVPAGYGSQYLDDGFTAAGMNAGGFALP